MGRTENANRARTARRIIRLAYGIKADSGNPRVIRFELIGSDIAVVLVAEEGKRLPSVKVAREFPGEKAQPLTEECRSDFAAYTDVVAHVERLYARYGDTAALRPNATPPFRRSDR